MRNAPQTKMPGARAPGIDMMNSQVSRTFSSPYQLCGRVCRLTPPLASSCCNRQPVSGLPLTPALLASLVPSLRVSPDPLPQLAFRSPPRVAALPRSSGQHRPAVLRVASILPPFRATVVEFRVAPFPRSSGNASDRFSLGLPRGSELSPGPLDLPVVPNLTPRVAPDHCPLRLAPAAGFRGRPQSLVLRCRRCCVPGLPRFLPFSGWVDDDSPA